MADSIAEGARYETPGARRGGTRFKNLRVNNQIETTPQAGTTVTGFLKNTSARVQRLIESDSTPTTVDEMIYVKAVYSSGTPLVYFINNCTATSGTVRALRSRAEGAAASASTAEVYGVHAQGVAVASLNAGTVNALYAEAIAKGTSTVTTLRGAFIAADSENTPTTITNMTGCHIRCKTSVAITTDFNGLIVETEKFGAGVAMDNLILVKDTTWAGGSTISTDGLAFETTGDITNLIYNASNCTNFIKWSATSGKGVAAGSLKDSADADIKCDYRVTCDIAGTTYYLALYDTVV
jgi:hypothetical protein